VVIGGTVLYIGVNCTKMPGTAVEHTALLTPLVNVSVNVNVDLYSAQPKHKTSNALYVPVRSEHHKCFQNNVV